MMEDDNLAYEYVADDNLAYTTNAQADDYGYYDGSAGSYYDPVQADDYNWEQSYSNPDPYADYAYNPGSGSDPYEDIARDYVYKASGNNSGIASSLWNSISKAFKDSKGNTDWRKVATAAAGLVSATGAFDKYTKAQNTAPRGYQGGIPSYSLVREQVQDTYDPNRRPGSGGRRYFSDVTYSPAAGVEAARTAAREQAAGLASLNMANPANQYTTTPTAPVTPTPQEPAPAERAASEVINDLPVPTYNQGGIAALKQGTYLRGETDGMTDELRTTIDGKQPAALSHGEFVIPADVVSHLGNGNSDAGAKKLYEMMNKIRKARTGTEKQGRQINPNKFLPK
jgi:hypothetical protein